MSCKFHCIPLAITRAYKCSWQFLAILPGVQRGSVTHKTYFLKMNIMELKTELNIKGISVSHSSEVGTVDALNDDRKYCLLAYNDH